MKYDVCDCCGHPDGVCPRCERKHIPSAEDGCESCIKHYDVRPAFSNSPVYTGRVSDEKKSA